jgi:hypothetical protein
VRGFSQKEGVDYNEVFRPVARFDTIQAVLSIAAKEHLELAQFDVKMAFLNGVLDEEIFMEQPEGFNDGTDRVCELHKSLYGLKQSPRCWNKHFKEVLKDYGLCESKADPCLFYSANNCGKLVVVIYVDDGLVAATDKGKIKEFLQCLEKEFKITSEPCGYFLNILIKQEQDGSIFISQSA